MRFGPSRCHRVLLFFAILSILYRIEPISAQSASADTVVVDAEAAIRRAIEISPEVGAVETNREYAEARRNLALASRYLTEFGAETAHAPAPGLYNPNDTPTDRLYLDPDVRNEWGRLRPFNQIRVQLAQPIYTWGELGGSIRAARYGVDVEAAAVRGKELEVAARTGEIYYGVLLAEALFRLTEEAGNILNQAKTEIRRLLDEGAEGVDEADLYQVLITEQEYNRRVVEVVQRRQTAYAALRRQLFLPDGTVVRPAADNLEPIEMPIDSLATYFEIGLSSRSELARATAGLAATNALVDVARSGYYPKLFLGASARLAGTPGRYRQPNPYISDPLRGRGFEAGLGMRLDLNFAQTRARVEQARAERNEVGFQMTAARQLILFEIEEAYRNLIVAKSALDAQTETLRLTREWMLSETINFDLDLGDTENLVDAVRSKLDQEVAYFNMVYQYNLAVLRLLRATGVLTERAETGTLVDSNQ